VRLLLSELRFREWMASTGWESDTHRRLTVFIETLRSRQRLNVDESSMLRKLEEIQQQVEREGRSVRFEVAGGPGRDERTESELLALGDRFPVVFRYLGRQLDRFEQSRKGTIPRPIRDAAGAAALPYEPIGEPEHNTWRRLRDPERQEGD
jgi:hypothetical protein